MKAIRAAILSLLLVAPAVAVEPTLPTATVTTTLPTGWDGTADATPANAAALTTALAAINQNVGNPYIIELTAGATYAGQFKLPNKTGTDWVIIRSSNYASLPAAGTRVGPSDASNMAKIQGTGGGVASAMYAEFEAHNIRLIGIELTTDYAVRTSNLNSIVFIGRDPVLDQYATTVEDQPTNIIFDRCWVHGTATGNIRRGISLDGTYNAVIDSYISDIHEVGADTQGILTFQGAGPFLIHNNYIEGAAENYLAGGADPSITNLVPSDITITRNLFSKPLTWKLDDPSYAGIEWQCKNLFELKNCRRVLVEGNTFENNWFHAQDGHAILFKPVNQNNTAPWSTVEDVTFRNNIVRNTACGIKLANDDQDGNFSEPMARVLFENNLVLTNQEDFGGAGKLVSLLQSGLEPATDVIFRHDTFLHLGTGDSDAAFIVGDATGFCTNIVINDNLFTHGVYGIKGAGASIGTASLEAHLPGYTFLNNAIVGAANVYPATTLRPADIAAVDFTNYAGGDYSLDPGSPYNNAGSDSEDIGVDWAALQAALAGDGPPGESSLLLINSAAGLLPIEVAE